MTTCTDAGSVPTAPSCTRCARDDDGHPLFGSVAQGAQAGDRVLASLASEDLCVDVTLPLAAPDTVEGLSTVATFTFDAEQTTNNPGRAAARPAPLHTVTRPTGRVTVTCVASVARSQAGDPWAELLPSPVPRSRPQAFMSMRSPPIGMGPPERRRRRDGEQSISSRRGTEGESLWSTEPQHEA